MFTFSLPMEYVEALFKLLLADSVKSKRLRDSDIIIHYLSDALFGEEEPKEVKK